MRFDAFPFRMQHQERNRLLSRGTHRVCCELIVQPHHQARRFTLHFGDGQR